METMGRGDGGRVRLPWWLRMLRVLLAAGPDFAIAAGFLIVWLYPYYFGPMAVKQSMFVMLLEFLVVHSTAFMGAVGNSSGSPWKKAGMYLALLSFYCLFSGAFSLAYGSWWPFLAFLGLMAPKAPGIIFGRMADEDMGPYMATWAAGVFFYVGGIFATVTFPIPEFGITPDVVATQDLGTGGIWQEQPHTVVAFGFLYFAAVGLFEFVRDPAVSFVMSKQAEASRVAQNGA